MKQLESRKERDEGMVEVLREELIDGGGKVVKRGVSFRKQVEKWGEGLDFGICREVERLRLE